MSEEIQTPVLRNDEETLEERMSENAYEKILPARYLKKDEDGNIIEEQEEMFKRVARNIAVAEYVFEEGIDEEHAPEMTHDQVVSGDIWNEDFGPDGNQDKNGLHKMDEWAGKFQEHMEHLKFMPNTPTLINAGTDMQQLSACISGETPIYTSDGLKKMKNVSEGDEVLTHTGSFKKVTNHWSNGVKETNELKRGRASGENYDAVMTPDHEVLTEEEEWVRSDSIDSAKQPFVDPEVSFPETIDLTQYTSVMRKDKPVVSDGGVLKVKNGNDPRTGEYDQQYSKVTSTIENNEQFAYLMGAYIAEGDIDGSDTRFTIGVNEDCFKQKITTAIKDIFDTHIAVSKSSHGGWQTISISSPFVADMFLSLFGTGSTEKNLPKWVFAASESYQESLLKGLLDGDGHFDGSGHKLTLANPTLAYEASLLARNIGKGVNFTLNGENELSVNPTSRVRISESHNHHMNTISRRKSDDVEVFDMEVEDDHSFVAGDFIVHNCFVNSPQDDLQDIGDTETESSLIFQSGGGVGYDFGKIRPYGDIVGSTGGIASGPITFMHRFDQNCETIAQGGVRRGAQMGTMQVTHPDIIHFIHAKNKDVSLAHQLRLNDPDDPTYTDFGKAIEEARELIDEEGRVPEHLRNAVEGHLSNFNISVTITDEFMEALQNGEDYTLINPRTGEPHIASEETKEMYEWFGLGDEVTVGEALSLPAEEIWSRIIEGAYENGEPGVMFIDTVNQEHSFDTDLHPEYEMTTSNPCGEQNLMEYEACNLGHINLSTVVDENPVPWSEYTEKQSDVNEYFEETVSEFLDRMIDWDELNERIEVGTRFLDNVVTMSDFPIGEISETVRKNRKIGLGIMGLAQLYVQLGVRYGSDVGNEIARQLMKHINHESKAVSHGLSEERGVFENWEDSKYAEPQEYPEWFKKHTGLSAVDRTGYPIRNHNTTTIAPTGTTSRISDTTGGCEPIYNVAFYKNVTDDVQGDEMLVVFDSLFLKTLEENGIDVESVKEEAKDLMSKNQFDGVSDLETVPEEVGDLFITTGDLDSQEHASIMCALQEGVDSSISKTLNAPKSATLDDAKNTFEYVYENGGKSVTFYRDGSRTKQVNTTRKDNQETSDEQTEGVTEALPRERPKVTNGTTHRVSTGYGNLYVTINEDEHGPVELFATVGKSGGTMESFSEALARQVSLSLRAGIPVDEIVDQLEGIRSPNTGWDNQETIHSIPDAIATALKRSYMDSDEDEEEDMLNHPTTDVEVEQSGNSATSDEPCPDCGGMSVYLSEGCKTCEACGWSEC
jgi:ribonucleoside-diphosphate reductase alpha chain